MRTPVCFKRLPNCICRSVTALCSGMELSTVGLINGSRTKPCPLLTLPTCFPMQSKTVATETMWPTKPKIFPSIWPFTESVGPFMAAKTEAGDPDGHLKLPFTTLYNCSRPQCPRLEMVLGAAVGHMIMCGYGVK